MGSEEVIAPVATSHTVKDPVIKAYMKYIFKTDGNEYEKSLILQ